MGGAQPLAVTMNEGTCLIIDVDESRLRRRVADRYLDEVYDNLDVAIDRAVQAKNQKLAISIGLVGNAAAVLPELLRRDVPVDIVTDQTSAHDPLFYIPAGMDFDSAAQARIDDPADFTKRSQ